MKFLWFKLNKYISQETYFEYSKYIEKRIKKNIPHNVYIDYLMSWRSVDVFDKFLLDFNKKTYTHKQVKKILGIKARRGKT